MKYVTYLLFLFTILTYGCSEGGLTNEDCIVGNSCDDGNTNTINDVFNINCQCQGTEINNNIVTDVDGNNYRIAYIGTQVWMADNLKTTKYCNNTVIPNITDNTEWRNQVLGAWSYYDNDYTNNDDFGKLYNYYAVLDSRNICPCGWHVPTESDWEILFDFLDNNSGKMKTMGTIEDGTGLWKTPNVGATNSSGFSGVPSGIRGDTFFAHKGLVGYWWISDVEGAFLFEYTGTEIPYDANPRWVGAAIRCIKD